MEGSGGGSRSTLNLCHMWSSLGNGDDLGAEIEANYTSSSREKLRKTRMKEDMGSLPGSLLSKVTVGVLGREQEWRWVGRVTEDGGRGRARGT